MVLLAAGFTCDENFCFLSSMERLNWTFLLHVVIIYQFMYSVMVSEFKDSEGWKFGVGI